MIVVKNDKDQIDLVICAKIVDGILQRENSKKGETKELLSKASHRGELKNGGMRPTKKTVRENRYCTIGLTQFSRLEHHQRVNKTRAKCQNPCSVDDNHVLSFRDPFPNTSIISAFRRTA